jgi:oxalate decarboxylase/phosphoglucose isomerase-like protein (cupin superfamily)
MKGGCYYYTKSGWVKNKNYEKTPELRFEKPLKSIPKNIDFLKNPEIQ